MNDTQIPEPLDLGDGRTVLWDEPSTSFYRVRQPNGEVWALPAKAQATPENAVDDIIDNPPSPPAPVVVLTPLTIISRLTPAEQVAIFTSSDPEVIVWRVQALAALDIRSDDPRTADGFDLLVSKGLLAPSRPAELMAA